MFKYDNNTLPGSISTTICTHHGNPSYIILVLLEFIFEMIFKTHHVSVSYRSYSVFKQLTQPNYLYNPKYLRT